MLSNLHSFLADQPVLVFFLVLSFGYLIGGIRVFGISLGSVGIGLGALAITIGGVTIELGMAGGLLLTGLLIGFLRSIWPVFGRVLLASSSLAPGQWSP